MNVPFRLSSKPNPKIFKWVFFVAIFRAGWGSPKSLGMGNGCLN